SYVLRRRQHCLLCHIGSERGSVQALTCAACAAKIRHCLHELSSGATRTAWRIGGDAVDHPGSARPSHRIAHEGIQAGIVLVDLEIAGGILHQHFVPTRSTERAEANDMEIAADCSDHLAAESIDA